MSEKSIDLGNRARPPYFLVDKEVLATDADYQELYDVTTSFLVDRFDDFSFSENKYGVLTGEAFYSDNEIRVRVLDKDNHIGVSFGKRDDSPYGYEPIGSRIGPVSPKYNNISWLKISKSDNIITSYSLDPHDPSGETPLLLHQQTCVATIELMSWINMMKEARE